MTGDTRPAGDATPDHTSESGSPPPAVPVDVLDRDPESGRVPVVPPYTADTDSQHVPADVLYQVKAVEDGIADGLRSGTHGVDEWRVAVASPIDGCARECAAVVNGIAGSVLTATDDSTRALDGIVDRAIRAVGKRLSGIVDEARAAGVDVPYDPGVWIMMAEESPAEWLPHLVPEIGRAVGVVPVLDPGPPRGDPAADGVDCTRFPFDPACQPGGGVPPGGPPIVPPLPGPGPGPIDQGGGNVPPPPIEPPPFPPPPIGGDDGTCPAPVCCPAGDTIVNVPPPVVILSPPVPGPTGYPPTVPPYPTCPDPAPIDIDVTVSPPTVPPPPLVDGAGPMGGVRHADGVPELSWLAPWPCGDIDTIIRSIDNPAPRPQPTGQSPVGFVMSSFAALSYVYEQILPQPFVHETEGLNHVSSAVMAAPLSMLTAAAKAAEPVLSTVSGAAVPNPAAAARFGAQLAVAGFVEANTHFPMSYLFTAERYAFQYANPQYLPSQHQCDAMYAMGRIDDEMWTCWTAANGNIPQHARIYRDTLIGHPSFDDCNRLRLRKDITVDQWKKLTHRIGWRDEEFRDEAFKLTTQIPSQTDLLRMMVRDAADQSVVDKYGYDFQFKDKFDGKLKDWAEAQGIPAQIFLYYWRAHWVIPSNTQLYEMFHRLRPDRPEVVAWDEFAAQNGEGPAELQLGPRPEVVTIEEVRTALQVNDVAPFWVQKLIDISYHPITRTDAVRAYQIGSFNRNQLLNAMMDNGYNRETAETLVGFYRQQSDRATANATGVLTIRKAVSLYKAGGLTRREADDAIRPLMKDDERRAALLVRVDQEMAAQIKVEKLKGLRKRFIAGEDEPGGWLGAIIAVTNDAEQALRILQQWEVLYLARLREPTALMLCKWYNHNVISARDYVKRLTNLGYSDQDAINIASVCDQDKRAAVARAQESRRKAQEAQDAKRKKEKEKEEERRCHPPKPCADGSPAPGTSG